MLFLYTASCSVDERKKYTTKYDNVDLDEIIKSDRLLKNYVDCLLEKRPCTPDGLELKSKLKYHLIYFKSNVTNLSIVMQI